MNLYLAGDHGGFFLKEHLTNYLAQKNIAFQDLGTKGNEKVDYPDIAKLFISPKIIICLIFQDFCH